MNPKIPTLEDIQNDIFGPSWGLIERWCEGDVGDFSDDILKQLDISPVSQLKRDIWEASQTDESGESQGDFGVTEETLSSDWGLPASLARLARLNAGVKNKHFDRQPEAGKIVLYDQLRGPDDEAPLDVVLSRPLVALLSEPTETDDVWSGWVVAPEIESHFAAEWDVLLEREDEPYLPSLAGIVQVWSPVQVYTKKIDRVIGQLKGSRLDAIRSYEYEMLMTDDEYTPDSVPGETSTVEFDNGVTLVTGVPLRDREDERLQYQMIYAQANHALKQPAIQAIIAAEPLEEPAFEEEIDDRKENVGDTVLGIVAGVVKGVQDYLKKIDLPPLMPVPEPELANASRVMRESIGAHFEVYTLENKVLLAFGEINEETLKIYIWLLEDSRVHAVVSEIGSEDGAVTCLWDGDEDEDGDWDWTKKGQGIDWNFPFPGEYELKLIIDDGEPIVIPIKYNSDEYENTRED